VHAAAVCARTAAHPHSPEQLFAVFHSIANDRPTPAGELVRLGKALHDCCARRCLSMEGSEVCWTWWPGARCADYLLYPVLTAATDLLTSGSRGLAVFGPSNARKRRWCSMADCGNRNKARQYYRREAGLI
jgi:predicted RNA-binding Zn ribbon-like protein